LAREARSLRQARSLAVGWNVSRRRALTLEEVSMPIFHFDIADGYRLEDPVGLDCANEQDAKRTADLIAHQIAVDVVSDNQERCVLVIDESGSEVYRTPVRR
jgi:hypothetical protein